MDLTELPTDILRLIGLKLNPVKLRLFKLTCKKINTACNGDSFWSNKTKLDYPNEFKDRGDNTSWLEYYIHLYGGKLFTFGNNRHGELGDGTNVNRWIPTEIKLFRNNVKSVSCGDYHTSVVTKDGGLYTFGYNKRGQLGDGTFTNRNTPTEIKLLKDKVKSVSCGDYHTSVVTKDGKLFRFGNNNCGQLGDGTDIYRNIPTEIKLLKDNIKSVSGGYLHIAAVTKDGRLFTFGRNNQGQLGDGTNEDRWIPTEIKLFRNNVKSVLSGYYHTIVVTKDGRLYTFGNNSHGQLGDGTDESRNIPTEIKFFRGKVKSVSCGDFHTTVVTKDDKLFGFGNNYYGQLGDGTNKSTWIPTEIKFFGGKVKSISCGYYHTVVVTKDGRLFSFGNNEYGQLGDGTNISRNIPTEIKLFRNNVKSVLCGYYHTVVVTN